MAGGKALQEHVVPRITDAAKECPPPRIIAGMPLAIVNDVAAARGVAAKVLQVYRDLPAYRAMLDRSDAAEPVDAALVGDPATIKDEIKRLEDIGVTKIRPCLPRGIRSLLSERSISWVRYRFLGFVMWVRYRFLGFVMNDASVSHTRFLREYR